MVDFPDVRDPGYSVSGLSREDRFRSNFGSFTVSWYGTGRYQRVNSEISRIFEMPGTVSVDTAGKIDFGVISVVSRYPGTVLNGTRV